MFFSTNLLKKCFDEISKVSEKDEGKTRQEKISQLRHILALSKLLKVHKTSTIDLSPDENKESRQEFISFVGDIVCIEPSSKLYTKDFKYYFDKKNDFSVGSNFLTTVVKKDKDYPGAQRGVAAIKVKKENLKLAASIGEALETDYKMSEIGWPLAIWLNRFVQFPEKSTANEIEQIVKTNIKNSFTPEVCEKFNLQNGFLLNFLNKISIDEKKLLSPNSLDINVFLENQKEIAPISDVIPVASKTLKPQNLNFIFYGPPGTGKTYQVIDFAVKLVLGDKAPKGREQIVKAFNDLRDNSIIEFITFHQSYSYEDFIEGLTPVVVEKESGTSAINYEIKDGVLKRFLHNFSTSKNQTENIVLVIDEINRGNISSIFGELISLLEFDKREGSINGIPVTLPYSKEDFILPKNLYILGTMNSTDRSIALMDFAIRRRFEFIYLGPKLEMIPLSVGKIPLRKIIEKINKQICYLLGKDYQIGQAFFLESEMNSISDVKNSWFNKLIPILGEYFYEDWEKIALLVPKFIHIEDITLGLRKDSAKIYRFLTAEEISDQDFETLLKDS